MRGDGAEEGFAWPERRGMRAGAASKRERRDRSVGLERSEAEGWVRVLAREGARVDGVAAGPAPYFQHAARAERGEAVPMRSRVVTGQGPGVKGEQVCGAGTASGSTTGVDGAGAQLPGRK